MPLASLSSLKPQGYHLLPALLQYFLNEPSYVHFHTPQPATFIHSSHCSHGNLCKMQIELCPQTLMASYCSQDRNSHPWVGLKLSCMVWPHLPSTVYLIKLEPLFFIFLPSFNSRMFHAVPHLTVWTWASDVLPSPLFHQTNTSSSSCQSRNHYFKPP